MTKSKSKKTVRKKASKPFRDYTFFATFGSGQQGYPGYVEINVVSQSKDKARDTAHKVMNQTYLHKWCALYDNFEEVHVNDRNLRNKL